MQLFINSVDSEFRRSSMMGIFFFLTFFVFGYSLDTMDDLRRAMIALKS